MKTKHVLMAVAGVGVVALAWWLLRSESPEEAAARLAEEGRQRQQTMIAAASTVGIQHILAITPRQGA